MRVIKYNIFYLFFISPFSFVQAQTITLVKNSFVCRGCENTVDKKQKPTIISMNKEISNVVTFESASKKIERYFTAPGDHFVLFCDTCKSQRMMGYPIKSSKQPNNATKGFGTYMYAKPSSVKNGKTKGSAVFYKFKELLDYLNEGLFLFDSAELSTAGIVNDRQVNYSTLRVSYNFKGTFIEREIPYDEEKQSFFINYRTLFGNKLTREMTDSLHIGLFYQAGNDETVLLPDAFKIFFANEVEKDDLIALFAMYKEAFPAWPVEAIAKELFITVQAKYKGASLNNLTEWLQNQK